MEGWQAGGARLVAEQPAVHEGRRLEAHLAQLRREVVRAAVAEGALLPEEAVDAARQLLHVLHPREGLRLVALEG